MTFKLQVVVCDGAKEVCQDVVSFEREEATLATLGLTLAEGKTVLGGLQEVVVEQQVAAHLKNQRGCWHCGKPQRLKGYHDATFRSLFGNLRLKSPRWQHCDCQPHHAKTFSPLAELLAERTSPELLYLETKWASLISYGLTAKLFHDVLPVCEKLSDVTIRNHLHKVAERSENALGDEALMLVEGCPRDWGQQPMPDGPLVVGIDGGFVHAREKGKWFEVIAGKSVLTFKRDTATAEPSSKCFGMMRTYDKKPKRRLFEVLKSQGMQDNQQVVFLSDGGDTVRNLQLYLNPEAEHVLDWFHIAMRFTVLKQYVKGLPAAEALQLGSRDQALEQLKRIKHLLWHGNIHRALRLANWFADDAECLDDPTDKGKKLAKATRELHTYLGNNGNFVPNYGERYRNGETISTAFVESIINQVVSKRMVKKQQMHWTPKGAHLLLQTRTKVLNGDLEETFRAWYPTFRLAGTASTPLAA